MAASVVTSGSVTTDGTEQTLATITTAGVYQIAVDCDALVGAADWVTVRWYGKARSSDSERLIDSATRAGTSVSRMLLTYALVSPHHLKVTVQRGGGTDRALPWAVYAP